MQNGYVRATAGRVSPLVPVAVVCVAVAGGLWWALGRGDSGAAQGAGESRVEDARAGQELRGPEKPAALTGAQGTATADAAASATTAAPRPAPVAWVWSKETVNQVLDTFYGREPDVDRLLAMVRYLGEKAVIPPESVWFEDDVSSVRGRVEIPELGLAGAFQIQRNRHEVYLETETGIPGIEERAFVIGMRMGETGIEAGHAYIHHSIYEQDQALQHKLAVENHPAGWEVRTNLARGTRAWPLYVSDPFAYEYDDKGPIPVPTQHTQEPVAEIIDRMRIDFGPWAVWREKIDAFKR